MRARVVLFLVSVMTIVPLVVLASHRDLSDKNDAPGALDVRAVKTGASRPPSWATYTWKGWSASKIFDRGFVLINFDTYGNEGFDYYALVRSDGSRLLASLYRDRRRKPDSHVTRLKVRRPGRASVRVWVRLGKMRFSTPSQYRWFVETLWTGSRCQNVCFDRAPNKGAVAEPAEGPGPTISPTITLTPTQSPSPSDSSS